MNAATLPALIQRFFTDRLCVQMEASRHTVAGYRDTFRLLLRFASVRHGKPPVKLTVEDIDADLVADFLVHGETARGNCARSRNTRLAAIRSFFRYVAMTDPTRLLHCQRVLAMPNKRYVKRAVTFLDAEEIAALLAAPDRMTWAGRRDHALLLLAIQTGLRASELVNLRCGDVMLGSGAYIRCMGKGRKERCTPLRRDTAKLLAAWIGDRPDDNRPLFPSIRGERLSRDALEHLVRKHCLTASRACPSIAAKRVTPHTLRHSTAMDLLHHGVDQAVIALWLGHEFGGDHPDLHPRRHADEGKGPRSRRRSGNANEPLPARRPTPRIPRRALIMPNHRMAKARQTGRQQRPCGIIPVTALWPLCRYRHNGHWSGAAHRLNRDLTGGFGSSSYAREELCAEMTGAFVCAAVPTVRHADYLASWLEVLREDNRAIIRAASAASKAADYLLAFRGQDDEAFVEGPAVPAIQRPMSELSLAAEVQP